MQEGSSQQQSWWPHSLSFPCQPSCHHSSGGVDPKNSPIKCPEHYFPSQSLLSGERDQKHILNPVALKTVISRDGKKNLTLKITCKVNALYFPYHGDSGKEQFYSCKSKLIFLEFFLMPKVKKNKKNFSLLLFLDHLLGMPSGYKPFGVYTSYHIKYSYLIHNFTFHHVSYLPSTVVWEY